MKQSNWWLCASKYCDWSRKNYTTVKLSVKPDSSVAPRGMNTYSESRIKLRNLQIFKKMPENASQFLSSEQLCEPRSLDVASKIAEVEKLNSETACCSYHHLIRVLNERGVGDGGNFGLLWLVILKSV